MIRRATAADATALAHLEAACFPQPWSIGQIADELAHPAASVLVAPEEPSAPPEHRRTLLGYAAFRTAAGEGELLRIAVAPAARRRGLAAALLTAGLDLLTAAGCAVCHLEVDERNLPAIRLYEGANFHRVGGRPGYYGYGRGALLYARALRPAP